MMYIIIKWLYLTSFVLVKKGFKYFIGYKDNQKVKPLCIILPKIRGLRKNTVFDKKMMNY